MLIVDNDLELNPLLTRDLGQFGLAALTAPHPRLGIELLKKNQLKFNCGDFYLRIRLHTVRRF